MKEHFSEKVDTKSESVPPETEDIKLKAFETHLHLVLLKSMLSDLTVAAKSDPQFEKKRMNTFIRFNEVCIVELYNTQSPEYNLALQEILTQEETPSKKVHN